jgi:O-methyltransferase
MIGRVRLQNVRCAVEEVNWNRVYGDIVEPGVWRGGDNDYGGICDEKIKNSTSHSSFRRFRKSRYLRRHKGLSKSIGAGCWRSFSHIRVRCHNVTIMYVVPGLFKNTLPTWRQEISRITVLRIDGNFYDSYQDAMYWLYKTVLIGGLVTFDDIFSHAALMEF